MTTPFDKILVDAGGDEVLVLSGDFATPENVERELELLRVERLQRLEGATPAERDLFDRWVHRGEHVWAKRLVPEFGPDRQPLTVYLDAPGLDAALARERELGATEGDLRIFQRMSEAGLIFGRCSSVAEPTGEPGSIHTCDLTAITLAEYEQAQGQGWRP